MQPNNFIPAFQASNTSVHAEQLVAMARDWQGPATIGVNYLCCATCSEEIASDHELQVRGTHGIRFPSVVRSLTRGIIVDTDRATSSVALEASDSESDSEQEKIRKTEKIPKRETNRSRSILSSNRSILFPVSTSTPKLRSLILLDNLIEELSHKPRTDNNVNDSEASSAKLTRKMGQH